ncbi:MAG: hypothetical protein PUG04_03380 [Lachnospiraceae bacterium]|nr:hypothetical protein [Lachnospiraceae bacterium]
MIEQYLSNRLDLLNNKKKDLKDSLIEIRASLHESKRELDDYMSSTSRPFEPFSPRRDSKDDEHLISLSDKIKSLNSQFEDVSQNLTSVESEIDQVNQCLDEFYSEYKDHNV